MAHLADQLIPLYPTSLLIRSIPDMEETNRQLAALIRGMEAAAPNAVAGSSNEGGYQTNTEFLSSNHPAVNTLKQHIRSAVRSYAAVLIEQECAARPAKVEFTIWGWAVILRAGNSQGIHVHPYTNISGVYYVEAPSSLLEGASEKGKICFHDPRPRANMNQLPNQNTRRSKTPVPGDMVLFPSWLEHSVSAFRGEGERICIAFNASLVMS